MRQDLTDITVVLDRSGSMASVAADTIGGFNRFVADQKAAPGAATLTLNQFDNVFENVHAARAIGEVPPLDALTFVPRGGTALLDAIGRSINETGARLSSTPDADRPGKVLFVILTDGDENASKEFDREKVLQMISHQRDAYRWEFLFLGANQDAIKAGGSIGIAAANSMSFASNARGTQSAFASTSSNVAKWRAGGQGVGYTAADRNAQVAAGAKP